MSRVVPRPSKTPGKNKQAGKPRKVPKTARSVPTTRTPQK